MEPSPTKPDFKCWWDNHAEEIHRIASQYFGDEGTLIASEVYATLEKESHTDAIDTPMARVRTILLNRWWEKNLAEIYKSAKRYPEHGTDVVHQVFVTMQKEIQLRGITDPRAYVRKALHNQNINEWRKDTGRGRRSFPEHPEDLRGASEAAEPNLERQVYRREILDAVEKGVADGALSNADRRAFVGHFFVNLTDEGMAVSEGVSGESTIRQRREKVRRYLERKGFEAWPDTSARV